MRNSSFFTAFNLWKAILCCIAAICFCILSSSMPATAETIISSSKNISADETWYLADSPFYINGNITIEAGATLTIEAGCELLISGSILLHGRLEGNGASNHLVVITKQEANGTSAS